MRSLPTKLNRKQFQFKNTLIKNGITPDTDEFWEAWDEEGLNEVPEPEPVKVSRSAAIIADEYTKRMEREAELVLASLFNLDVLRQRECKQCRSLFATNYNYERYCSNLCRITALRARGINWNPDKPEDERWQGQPPSTIGPGTLSELRNWAYSLIDASIDYTPRDPNKPLSPMEQTLKAIYEPEIQSKLMADANQVFETIFSHKQDEGGFVTFPVHTRPVTHVAETVAESHQEQSNSEVKKRFSWMT